MPEREQVLGGQPRAAPVLDPDVGVVGEPRLVDDHQRQPARDARRPRSGGPPGSAQMHSDWTTASCTPSWSGTSSSASPALSIVRAMPWSSRPAAGSVNACARPSVSSRPIASLRPERSRRAAGSGPE